MEETWSRDEYIEAIKVGSMWQAQNYIMLYPGHKLEIKFVAPDGQIAGWATGNHLEPDMMMTWASADEFIEDTWVPYRELKFFLIWKDDPHSIRWFNNFADALGFKSDSTGEPVLCIFDTDDESVVDWNPVEAKRIYDAGKMKTCFLHPDGCPENPSRDDLARDLAKYLVSLRNQQKSEQNADDGILSTIKSMIDSMPLMDLKVGQIKLDPETGRFEFVSS